MKIDITALERLAECEPAGPADATATCGNRHAREAACGAHCPPTASDSHVR
jgi:hypothetical protein